MKRNGWRLWAWKGEGHSAIGMMKSNLASVRPCKDDQAANCADHAERGITVRTALETLRQAIDPFTETARGDAQVALAHIMAETRAWILAHPEASLSRSQIEDLQRRAARLRRGEPLPYVLGTWEFHSLTFAVSPEVLIPRPETEGLVEAALAWLQSHPHRRLAVDVGTGSGCIAVTLAKHTPDLRVTAIDLSAAALQVSQENARAHGVDDRITFIQGYLLEPVGGLLDLICANPPYIPSQKLRGLNVYGREPTLALDGGPDGLDLVRTLLMQIPRRLAPGGLALIEIEASQGIDAVRLANAALPHARIELLPDLAGRDRVLQIEAH
jgi:release factor glutamine methyltransferase